MRILGKSLSMARVDTTGHRLWLESDKLEGIFVRTFQMSIDLGFICFKHCFFLYHAKQQQLPHTTSPTIAVTDHQLTFFLSLDRDMPRATNTHRHSYKANVISSKQQVVSLIERLHVFACSIWTVAIDAQSRNFEIISWFFLKLLNFKSFWRRYFKF